MKSTINSFSTGVALRVGVNSAVVYNLIKTFIDIGGFSITDDDTGKVNVWARIPVSLFTKHLPFYTSRQIETYLNKLLDADLIRSGKFNADPFDQALWYITTKSLYGADK